MCTVEQEPIAARAAGQVERGGERRGSPPGRVELIDHWHRDWEKVLARVEALGQRKSIGVDEDGWMSARQNLLAAFVEEQPAGHLCFRVEPVCRKGHVVVDDGRPVVAARVEAVGIYPGFSDGEVRRMLADAAVRRARELSCRELHGFEPESAEV